MSDLLSNYNSDLQKSNLAVVVPVLNEAGSIERVLDEVFEVLKGENFRIIVVDGRSTDGTDKIAARKGAIVVYQKNDGYGNALKTGFLYCMKHLYAKVIVMMDGDLSYDAKDIPQLVAPILRDDTDLCIGNRFGSIQKGAMPRLNRFGNRVLSLLARLALGLTVHDTQCGMRAFRSELFNIIDLRCEGMPIATEMLVEARSMGARVSEVPIAYRERVGTTKLNPLKDGFRILATIIKSCSKLGKRM